MNSLQTGERVRFTIPTGYVMELASDKTDVGNGQPYTNRIRDPSLEYRHRPHRFDHCPLYGPNLEENLAEITEVLGFHPLERVAETASPCSPPLYPLRFAQGARPGLFCRPISSCCCKLPVLPARQLRRCCVRRHHKPMNFGVDRHRPHPPRHHPRLDDLRLDPRQPLRDLCGGYETYPDHAPIT